MSQFRVVITDQELPNLEIERSLLGAIGAEIIVADGTPAAVADAVREADGLLNTYFPIDTQLIAGMSRCRVIARYGVGTDNIDLAAAAAAGIVVTNVPDYSVQEVATHALAMLLGLLRKLPQANGVVVEGGWGIETLRPVRRPSTLTFGLVGLGRIARELALLLSPLGGEIIAYDPYVRGPAGTTRLVSFDELLGASDAISIHAPLTPETRGLFNSDRFAQMRSGSFLVNTSRGPLVVLDDLVTALRSGQLSGAALDVFENEPPDVTKLAGVPNLLLSPHMAYYSEESLQEAQRKAATQVVKVLSGVMPDYQVN